LAEEALSFAAADLGTTVVRGPVPEAYREAVKEARLALTEAAADFDDGVMEAFLNGETVPAGELQAALRRGTLQGRLFPVLIGSALHNQGVQPVLDAVCHYLPSPQEAPPPQARRPGEEQTRPLACDPAGAVTALAFKVMAESGRRLTYLRIYRGTLKAGATLTVANSGKSEKIRHLFRMHAHKREELPQAAAGEIVAATGCQFALTGDTLCDPADPLLLAGVAVPEPVVSIAVEAKGAGDREQFLTTLEYFQWEDPTLRVHEDQETGQTILTGMGELHLEIVLDRLRREYGVEVMTGKPRVVYREALSRQVERLEPRCRAAAASASSFPSPRRRSPRSFWRRSGKA
jgi:elongation factor G